MSPRSITRGLMALGLCLAWLSAFPQAPVEPGSGPGGDSGVDDGIVATLVAEDDDIVDMGVVVVSGVQPGPGLWRVSRDGHTLYVLGEVSPLPRRMDWMWNEVETVAAQSTVILASPAVSMGSDIGAFRGLMLVPSLLRARRNPGGKRLADVVPAESYARWQSLKARYMGASNRVERWRPIFASQELYNDAIKQVGLRQDSVVQPLVARVAKAHAIPVVSTTVEIKVEDPKALIREFGSGPLDDVACFDRTLARIEHDLQRMGERANAWATGDIEALRALPTQSQFAACMRVLTESGIAQRLGITDIDQQLETRWLAAAEQALADNATSFATLPMSLVLSPDGYLAKLAEKGYAVEAP
ncbi:TraB/GumN family protein [Luteimonas sp. BDR2-5]|uniref:TraB/GumN family protein n=1 Tax=Proluteimonas luteida TaxID=2878685 RepID=UPI001E355719|nr:TraB/GumN family protein [Luteimonas sp. BDR2-5]MCD9029391.1 TraB/GumN family protein [Luteimonas sp. BDR2-5]